MEAKKVDKEFEAIQRVFDSRKRGKKGREMSMCLLVVLIGIIIVSVALISASIINVPAGHKGVVTSGFGVGEQFNEGYQIKNPLSQVEYVRYNTQFKKEEVSILTNDEYDVPIDVQVVYHLVEDRVGEIRTENPEYSDTVIMNEMRSEVRHIVAIRNYTGYDINTKRADLEIELFNRLESKLMEYHIVLESVNIRNVDLPATILSATEQRQAAKVGVQTAKYNLEAAEFNAQQKVVTARAERNVTVIEAQAQADAQSILANQSKEMNETVMNFIMFMKWVNMLKDPDCNVEFYIVPEGVPVILDPSEIKG